MRGRRNGFNRITRDVFHLPWGEGGEGRRAQANASPGLYRLSYHEVSAREWVYTETPVQVHWWTLPSEEQQRIMASFVKRAQEAREQARTTEGAQDAAFRSRFPALWEWLSVDAYDDGGARETATLLIFFDEGAFKCCLNDRDQGRSLWATGGSFDGAMQALEAFLATGEGDWRSNQSGKKGKSKK